MDVMNGSFQRKRRVNDSRGDKNYFSVTADHTRRENVETRPMRGGFRLS